MIVRFKLQRGCFWNRDKNHPDAPSIEKAVTYLENASFYSLMNDQDALDRIFRESIIKSFAVMLTDIDEVKSFLNSRISSDRMNGLAFRRLTRNWNRWLRINISGKVAQELLKR